MTPRYTIDLDIQGHFGPTITIDGMGADGTLVGYCRAQHRALSIIDGRLHWLGPLDRRSRASATAQGRVYGSVDGRACRFEGERVVELGGLGGEVSGVKAASGDHVVGWSDTDRFDTYEAGTPNEHQSCRRVGVRWDQDRPIELPTLGGPNGMSEAVNAHGTVVGWSDLDLEGRGLACRWSPEGTVASTSIGVDAQNSKATGINDRGEWIGSVHDATDRYRPFVERVAGFQWLALPGDSAFLGAIDNQGWIVGTVSWKHERHSWPLRVRGYLWIGEEAHELDQSIDGLGDRSVTHATSIDEAGTILASVEGPSRQVLLRPR